MSSMDKAQEIQFLEQNMQNILLQKQAFQMELSETQEALKEVKNSKDEVFRIVGQIMIKSDREKVIEELSSKEKILDLRLKSLEKQESSLEEKLVSLRKELLENNKSK